MKKIKLLTSLAGLSALSAGLIPAISSCGCSTTSYNTVSLAKGQTLERTVGTHTEILVFRFKQENLLDADSTKVSISDFAVNGVAHHVWAKTFTYLVDSAGHITLQLNTALIMNSMSNDVTNISFNLVFKNKKSETRYVVGPFTVNFDEAEDVQVEESEDVEDFNPNISDPTVDGIFDRHTVKLTPTKSDEYIQTVELTNTDTNEPMEEGKDFSFHVADETPTAGAESTCCLVINNLGSGFPNFELSKVITSKNKPLNDIQVDCNNVASEEANYISILDSDISRLGIWPSEDNGGFFVVNNANITNMSISAYNVSGNTKIDSITSISEFLPNYDRIHVSLPENDVLGVSIAITATYKEAEKDEETIKISFAAWSLPYETKKHEGEEDW